MSVSLLSRGALNAVFGSDEGSKIAEPVVQCVQIKQMEKKDENQPDRWRLVLSDADNFIQSMLATRTSTAAVMFLQNH